ncbi:MAG: virulence protein RhuM/Fic/DOC family protein [bacterium]|nr:virulence protein RhuM/Fic/DOC family protein [bacterium]
MKKNYKKKNEIVIYQAKTGAIELRGDFGKETIWATLDQIADVFGRDKSVISRHLQNIYKENELDEKATVAKNATVQLEGARRVERIIEYYNLDAIISVGYRVNSKTATKFRQWATKTLHQHITKGYTINPKVIKNNYTEFQKAIENIKHLLPADSPIDHASVLELISAFADTWLSLDAYDKDELTTKGTTRKSVELTSEHIKNALTDFKASLIKKGEATALFGNERSTGNVAGIIGNVMQSFGGKPVYPTIEEKAAHLLYFMVKNHPFTDGNKRSGAYAFVWFLNRADVLDRKTMTPPALTALTLFVAESDPKNKDRMIKLVLQLLKK